MFYNTSHVKGVIVYSTPMNPTSEGIVISYGSHLFKLCMKNTKYPSVAAISFLSIIKDHL